MRRRACTNFSSCNALGCTCKELVGGIFREPNGVVDGLVVPRLHFVGRELSDAADDVGLGELYVPVIRQSPVRFRKFGIDFDRPFERILCYLRNS